LNIEGYYDLLLDFANNKVEKGFLKEINQQMIIVSNDSENSLNKMQIIMLLKLQNGLKQGLNSLYI
jgi:predicted Rossmann-fold nucleotide-binding protein